MEQLIDLAPGAEDNALALRFAQRMRENLAAHPKKARDFDALRAAVWIVIQDRSESFTMRFDLGRLTLHDGSVGVPTVTFCADEAVLARLFDLPLSGLFRLPIAGLFSRDRGEPLRALVRRYLRGDLLIYGLTAHPRTVVRLLRVLSSDA